VKIERDRLVKSGMVEILTFGCLGLGLGLGSGWDKIWALACVHLWVTILWYSRRTRSISGIVSGFPMAVLFVHTF
jgi:hypothetical protein